MCNRYKLFKIKVEILFFLMTVHQLSTLSAAVPIGDQMNSDDLPTTNIRSHIKDLFCTWGNTMTSHQTAACNFFHLGALAAGTIKTWNHFKISQQIWKLHVHLFHPILMQVDLGCSCGAVQESVPVFFWWKITDRAVKQKHMSGHIPAFAPLHPAGFKSFFRVIIWAY